jgi:hypothetical protein
MNKLYVYKLIGDDSIINQKKFQAPKLIYRLIGDDSTIDQKIFQASKSISAKIRMDRSES